MPLHVSVTQKITEIWFHFWGHSATEFEGFPLVLIGQFAHAWVPRRPGKAGDVALSTRKRYRAIYTHGAQRQNVKIRKSLILKNRVLVSLGTTSRMLYSMSVGPYAPETLAIQRLSDSLACFERSLRCPRSLM